MQGEPIYMIMYDNAYHINDQIRLYIYQYFVVSYFVVSTVPADGNECLMKIPVNDFS